MQDCLAKILQTMGSTKMMATHALPMEMRRPATTAGAAPGRMTVSRRRHHESWRIAATFR